MNSEREFINELQKAEWRGILDGYVQEAHRDSCVVVDMGFNTVRILVTKEHYTSGAYISMLRELKNKHYTPEKEITGQSPAIKRIYELAASKSRSLSIASGDSEEERFIKLYDDCIAGGYRLKASDVHFEIDKGGRGAVRLRIFGRMRLWKTFDPEVLEHAIAAGYGSKTKSGTNSSGSFSLDRGMSTMTRHTVDGVQLLGRFTSNPTYDGGDAVVRILISDPKQIKIPTLDELGYAVSHIVKIRAALKRNRGLIAIAGSTGSGKSTTLRTMLENLPAKDELKVVAIEDPVEYMQEGVRKYSIQRGPDDPEEEVNMKFKSALRQQLRMDPDAIQIGEIRDYESGRIASEFVQTGHRLLTTIHGDSAPDVLARAAGEEIRIPTEIMAMRSFISAVMYQKLLPTLCSCKVPATQVLDQETLRIIKEKFKLDPNMMKCANHDGCEKCRIPGIAKSGGTKGQTVCAEILTTTAAIREAIRTRNWNEVERLWRSERTTSFSDPDMTGKTAFEHALYKASIGEIDIRDIEADFEPLSEYEIFEIPAGGRAQ